MLKKCSVRDISIWAVCGAVIIFFVSILFFDEIVWAAVLSPYIIIYVRNKAADKNTEERRKLVTEFRDGMIAVSFSLNAGYSIENSFKEAVKELAELYGNEAAVTVYFKEIVRRMRNNENIETVISEFAAETQIEDIMYFSDVFSYAKRNGGDLISIIKNTANTIRDKVEADVQIQTALSGKKMEASLMSVMPLGITAYLRCTSPEFIEPLYHNVIGIAFMCVCLSVIVCMNAVAKKIVSIEI